MNKNRVAIIAVIVIAAGSVVISRINKKYAVPNLPITTHDQKKAEPQPPASQATSSPQSSISNLKSTILLKVPFTAQAPTANWDTLHNEDCEEASAIMANEYFSGNTSAKLEAADVEKQLTKLTDWEMQTFGYNLDISSEEVIKMIEVNYPLHTKLVTDYSEDDIKNELAQNHLVLIPENGQLLGNPNYKQPGPKYHMLVIKGYTSTSIITNDPGTRNGMNYSYSFDTLYSANGDWDHNSNSVDLNKKNVIVVWK